MPDLLHDEHVSPLITASEVVFTGAVWDIARETFTLDDAPIVREFVDHPGAVAIVALDERGRMLLIKQYRHPIRARDWELPAGLLDAQGESPLDAAKRELAEEVDLVAESWHILSEFTSSPGGSNEVIRIYLARGVSAAPATFERTEEEAGIELRWVPLDDVVEAVLARNVQNSILAIGALSAAAGRARGWATLASADAPWPSHPSVN